MTLKNAKDLYFFYNADAGAMMRDGQYEDFRKMNFSPETLLRWKQELIRRYKKIISGPASVRAKMQIIFKLDEMDDGDGSNKKFIFEYYLKNKAGSDLFSAILLLETLCKQDYKPILQENNYSLKEDADALMASVRKGEYFIDKSYKEDDFLDEEDFAQNNLLKRLEDIKEPGEKEEKKKRGFWKKLFAGKNRK